MPKNAELRHIQAQVDADWNELLVRCDEVST
jgi:hypothetical protein